MDVMEMVEAVAATEQNVLIGVHAHADSCPERSAFTIRWLDGARGARVTMLDNGFVSVQAFRWLTTMDEKPFGSEVVAPWAMLSVLLAGVHAGADAGSFA